MRIYDGDSITSPMLGNPYCGDSLPPSQISSNNQLFIHFYSNQFNTGTGFNLEYNATSKNQGLEDTPFKTIVFFNLRYIKIYQYFITATYGRRKYVLIVQDRNMILQHLLTFSFIVKKHNIGSQYIFLKFWIKIL